MPHVALIPLAGLRIREDEVRELGMTLPGLRERAAAIGELPSLGLLTLAGMLPDGWTCGYHPASEHSLDELVERVVAERPALAALSALTASIDEAYALSGKLRTAGVPVAIGGLHVTACSDEAAAHCDAAIAGDGEPVWPQVLADAAAGSLKPRYGPARSPPEPDWPMPRFDLLGPGRVPRFTLQTARGCPLACEFCGASRLLGPFREKPIEAVRQELESIRELDADPLIELADDNTFAGRRDAEELLDLLGRSKARYFTESDWRIGERPDVLAGLASSGCAQVLVGIESLPFRYPGMGPKEAPLERVMDAVRAIQEAGVAVNGCFIVGADGETRDSIDRLAEFTLASPLAEVQLTLQTPFPGTPLHRRLARDGRLLPNRGWQNYTLFDLVYRPDTMGVEELEQAYCDLLREVYAPAAVKRRETIRRKLWKSAQVALPRIGVPPLGGEFNS